MNNVFVDKNAHEYLFAQEQDFACYKNCQAKDNLKIEDNNLLAEDRLISKLIPIEHISEAVNRINRLSLEAERKMPSCGWRFALYKDRNGFLQEEFTKKEWLRKNVEYVGVSFSVASAFERENAKSLVSYFQSGGLLEAMAPNVYYYYDRLFAKYGGKPAAFKIEDVPELEDFMKNYMPLLYKDLLETATYELTENFDAKPYVEKIIKNHYTY